MLSDWTLDPINTTSIWYSLINPNPAYFDINSDSIINGSAFKGLLH